MPIIFSATNRMITDLKSNKDLTNLLAYLANSLSNTVPRNEYSLFYGDGGIAFALLQLAKHFQEDQEVEVNIDIVLDSVAEKLVTDPHPNLTFSVGCVGFLAAMELVDSPYDFSEINKYIDQTMVRLALDFRVKKLPFDPFKGVLGALNYLRIRKEFIEPAIFKKCLLEMVAFFDENKLNLYNGIAWEEENRKEHLLEQEKAIQCNLGLAHGSFAILYWLAYAYHETKSQKALELLNQGLTCLQSMSQAYKHANVIFPSVLNKDGTFDGNELSWCYGDLSASLVLINIGDLINHSECKTVGLKVARHSAKKALLIQHAPDSCLCHGSAGNALIFHLLWKKTGEKVMLEARDLLLNHLIKLAKETNFTGFQNREFNYLTNEIENKPLREMLNGEAGIALACLTMITEDSHDWLKLLLLKY